jgi:hypothetical protein
MWLWTVLACGAAPADTDPTGTDPSEMIDTDDVEAVDTGVPGWDPGWPDPNADALTPVHLVIDGRYVTAGDTVEMQAAPARSSRALSLAGVVVNRSDAEQVFSADPSAWIAAPGWTFAAPPPTSLDAGASAAFTLEYRPTGETAATVREDPLTVPGTEVAITLQVTVPRPNRAVLTGDGGWSAFSDDGGLTWTQSADAITTTRARDVVWGEGRFFRSWATGMGWFEEGRYAWSDDGVTWTDTTVADDFWPSDCTAGLDRFVCVRSDVISWSDSGASVIHEATQWKNMLNTVVWTGESYLAVGRSGRRAHSVDGASWSTEITPNYTDEWRNLACHDGTCVVVGGSDRYAVGVSTDNGYTWTDQVWPTSRYARLESVIWDGDGWLAMGVSNDDPHALWSADGLSWAAVEGFPRWDGYTLLGTLDATRFGVASKGLYASPDNATWTLVLTPPTGVTIRALAVEGR